MATASFEINGDNNEINYGEIDMKLFHNICRLLDIGVSPIENNIYFTKEDFREIKKWIVSQPFLLAGDFTSGICLNIDGYKLILKKKQ